MIVLCFLSYFEYFAVQRRLLYVQFYHVTAFYIAVRIMVCQSSTIIYIKVSAVLLLRFHISRLLLSIYIQQYCL